MSERDAEERVIHGLAAAPGVALGKAFVREPNRLHVPRYRIPSQHIEDEQRRLTAGVDDREHGPQGHQGLARADLALQQPLHRGRPGQLAEQQLPDLDDEFAQMASEFDTVEELTADDLPAGGPGAPAPPEAPPAPF